MKKSTSQITFLALLAFTPAWAAEPSPEARSFNIRQLADSLVSRGGACVDGADLQAAPETKAATRARLFRTFPKASELSFEAPSGFQAMTFRLDTKLLRSSNNRRDPMELVASANLFLASLEDEDPGLCRGSEREAFCPELRFIIAAVKPANYLALLTQCI